MSSNQKPMEDFLKPLSHIRQVDAPYFLKDRVMARIAAASEVVPAKTLALASAGFALLLLLTVLSAVRQPRQSDSYTSVMTANHQLYQ